MSDTIQLIAERAARRLLLARACEAAAVWTIACGLAAAAVQVAALVASAGPLWSWQVPLILLSEGVIIGCGRALLAGATPMEAAALVDARRNLAERFATAVELAESDRRDGPVAETCRRQAMAALGDRPLAGVSFWRRTRRTAGALGLVFVLTAALAMLGALRSSSRPALAGMDGKQRQRLAAELRRGAGSADRESVRQALAAAATAVEVMDEEELTRLLTQLRADGVELVQLTPQEVRDVLGLAEETASPDGGADGGDETTGSADGNAAPHAAGGVTVYDPLFSGSLAGDPRAGDAAANGSAVSYKDAWDHARRRTMASLRRGDVPPAYRDIIRRYFAER